MSVFSERDFANLGDSIESYRFTPGETARITAQANKLLQERGTVVYAYKNEPGFLWFGEEDECGIRKFKALLINIEPIEQKKVTISREDLERIFIVHEIREEDAFLIMEELGL